MVLNRLVTKVNVDDVLDGSVNVTQVLDVAVFFQQRLLPAEAWALDHHHLGVECLGALRDLARFAVAEDDDLVVLCHLIEEWAEAWSLEKLNTHAKAVGLMHQSALEVDDQSLGIGNPRDLVRQHLGHSRLRHNDSHIIEEPVDSLSRREEGLQHGHALLRLGVLLDQNKMVERRRHGRPASVLEGLAESKHDLTVQSHSLAVVLLVLELLLLFLFLRLFFLLRSLLGLLSGELPKGRLKGLDGACLLEIMSECSLNH